MSAVSDKPNACYSVRSHAAARAQAKINTAAILGTCLFAFSLACGPGLIDAPEEEHVFEGGALTKLLGQAPQRAEAPFARIGLRWDSPVESTLEVQFSDDGDAWSDWIPVTATFAEEADTLSSPTEMNDDAVAGSTWIYAGHADAPSAAATYFRLRAVDGADLTFASLELLRSVPELENGDAQGEPTLEGGAAGSASHALTSGSTYVNPRSAWGARASRCSATTDPYRFTIHHTGGPNNDSLSPQARIRQIQSYHMDSRGWCDIGYHFVVSHDARLWQARALPKRGAHAAYANTGNIGITFMGTYSTRPTSEPQLDGAAALLAGLADRYRIAVSRSTVKGHRELVATSCPGDALFGQMSSLVRRAQDGGQTSSIVIDSNNARNDERVGYIEVSSAWNASAWTPGYYGTGYWWLSTAPVSDPAVFHFYLSSAATKTVDAWWTGGSNRSKRAPFLVYDADGDRLATVRKDQQINGGQWNTLGTFNFTRGWNSIQLSRWTTEGYVVIADAIRVR